MPDSSFYDPRTAPPSRRNSVRFFDCLTHNWSATAPCPECMAGRRRLSDMSTPSPILMRSGAGASLPEPVDDLARALAARHGAVLVSREKNGLHLNLACPKCLEREGRIELVKRHLAINADKHLSLGKWEHGHLSDGKRDRVGLCMKCGFKASVSLMLAWIGLEGRGIRDSRVGKVSFVDNTVWLVKDALGNIVPGGPGNGPPAVNSCHPDDPDVILVTQLPAGHPAAEYLLNRGYDLDGLVEQFRCSYCVREWAESRESRRGYRRMPCGFKDSPQGRIIFFADVRGAQVSWQARIIDREIQLDGVRHKEFWNGHTGKWHVMEVWSEEKHKYVPLPQYSTGEVIWNPSKYRTATGTSRNEVLFGFDAAVRWNATNRRGRFPAAFSNEGPLDAGRWGPPGIARVGKTLSDAQVDLFASSFAHVIEVPDNDEAGRQVHSDTIKRLGGKVNTSTWQVPSALKDAGDLPDSMAKAVKYKLLSVLP